MTRSESKRYKEEMKTQKQKLQDKIEELEEIAKGNMSKHDCSFDEGLIYHKERYYKLKAQLKGFEQAEKEMIEKINSLENPYPTDIFLKTELSKTGTEKVNKFFRNEIGITLDNFSANLMRKARENLKEELIKSIGDGE